MEKLTPQEAVAMSVIWQVGEGNVKIFLQQLNNKVPYTTFASTIKNLERKGFLTSRLVGNVYLYKPIVKESVYKKTFLREIVKGHFNNSYKNLVNFFVDQKSITPRELKEIIALIEKGNKQP